MRSEGELIRKDGAAIDWRKLRIGAGEILVTTRRGVALPDPSRFLNDEIPP